MSNEARSPQDRLPWAAILFTVAYLAVGLVAALKRANWVFVFYIPIVIALGLIVLSIRKRAGFSNGLLMALSIWGLLHVFGGVAQVPEGWPIDGDIPSFYSWEIIPGYLGYDKPVHAFGFGVATWACWQGLVAATGAQRPTMGLLILSALAGMGLGAANEIVEFIASQTMNTNVGGYINTGGDLMRTFWGDGCSGGHLDWGLGPASYCDENCWGENGRGVASPLGAEFALGRTRGAASVNLA